MPMYGVIVPLSSMVVRMSGVIIGVGMGHMGGERWLSGIGGRVEGYGIYFFWMLEFFKKIILILCFFYSREGFHEPHRKNHIHAE
jgi:hypothetical protein